MTPRRAAESQQKLFLSSQKVRNKISESSELPNTLAPILRRRDSVEWERQVQQENGEKVEMREVGIVE